MASSELTDAEREAMRIASRKILVSLEPDEWFEEGWLAARDYYKAERQAKPGTRDMEEALDLLERHVPLPWNHPTGEVIEETEAFLRKHGRAFDDDKKLKESQRFDEALDKAIRSHA